MNSLWWIPNVLSRGSLVCIKNLQNVYIFKICFIYLAVLGLCCCTGFSLVVASGGFSLVEVHRLLVVVTSPVAEHRLQGIQVSVAAAPELYSTGSVVVVHRFSCPAACGIFPDQGSNLYLLRWQADSLPLSHQGSPKMCTSFDIATLLGIFLRRIYRTS